MSTFNVDQVLQELTLAEKISLIAAVDFWHTAPIERLGIPSIRVSDGPNGVRGTKFFDSVPSAAFPNGTGLAATFNKELLEKAGELMGREAIHKNAAVILGPTTNMQRGPLGGRGFESFSEDPYLAGVATSSVVNGIQSQGVAATVKHFVCNDLEDQRFSSNSIVTERALREIYLEPFRLAVRDSNPQCFMTAYNKVNDVHCSQNKKLLQDVLRGEWGWDGMVMSDWFGTYSSAEAIKNGLDIEFPGPTRWRKGDLISHLVNSKEAITEHDVDHRARNVLKLVKFFLENKDKTGIQENGPEDTKNNTPETSKALRGFASESIVLLKNNGNILPLKKEESVVVIGPNAKAQAYSGGGSASLNPYYVVSPYEGIRQKTGKDVEYTVGCQSHKSLSNLVEQLILDTSKPVKDGNVGVLAKFYAQPAELRNSDTEPFDEKVVTKSFITLFDYKNDSVDPKNPIFYVDFEGFYIPDETTDYIVGVQVFGTAVLYVDGKLVVYNKTNQRKGTFCFSSGTVEETAVLSLKKGQAYRFKVEYGSGPTSKFGEDFGAGGLQIGISKVIDEDAEIQNAAELAKKHEKVVLCIGLNGEWESEGYDRRNMTLPRRTNDLVRAVLEANPNTIVVNQSGTPVEIPWVSKCNALIHCWYGGNELGNAIADVLYGDFVPSGKLSLSWPLKLQDNPAYLNFSTEGGRVLYGEDIYVGYRYFEKLQRQVAFPFGYGLSYTEFKLENLQTSVDFSKGNLEVSVDAANIGDDYAGSEVVQVYIASTESKIGRPVKELKGFDKVYLQPGEKKTVKLNLVLKDSISFFDEYENKWCAEAGKYKVMVGTSSDDIELIGDFTVEKTTFWNGL